MFAGRLEFGVEVEELKKQTMCNRCGKRGHWARECKNLPAKGSNKGSSIVESPPDFVASAEDQCSMLEMRLMREGSSSSEVLLISSPGLEVLDSGCGRTIMGRGAG